MQLGYQTQLDTRSVIFKDDKILLVKERDGRSSRGWVIWTNPSAIIS